MTRKAKKYLFDISQAIAHIFENHLEGISTQEDFLNNFTVIRAVEREIGILGEATVQLRKLGVHLSNFDQLINRRNTIIHQYDDFKAVNIWTFIHEDLPDVKTEVEQLLNEPS